MITASNENHWILEQDKLIGNNPFIIYNSETFTYHQIFNFAQKAANYFKSYSIKKNDHVAILAEHNLEFITSVLGLWLIGAVPVILNKKSTKAELQKFIEISKSEIVITSQSLGIRKLSEIIFDRKNFKKYDKKFIPESYNKNNTAILMFTSGSTGIPKCVNLTFENLYQSTVSADGFIKHDYEDIWIASLPFQHIGGFSIFTRTLISGCKFVIPKSLTENDLYKSVKNSEPSLISAVPIMLTRIIKEFTNPWKNLRLLLLGGGPVSEDLAKSAIAANWPIAVVYGSTETSSMVSLSSIENIKKFGISAGKPLQNVKIRILDKNKNEIKNGNSGQIVISAKSIAKGYFNLISEEKNQLKDGDYFTNDIGKIDENGNLQILGRKDDIIISGGENISLTEIEKIFQKNFATIKIAAIGIKDKKWDQSYVLVIEGKEFENIEEEIIEYLKQNLAAYKLPKKILFVNNFPITELGKIKKNQLAKRLKLNVL
ncbi:MAG: acyl--CoA ligase [Ignavibacteriales bacterium]|nr:acyl--CoA ligase [Ignavibacteriales bacterium]